MEKQTLLEIISDLMIKYPNDSDLGGAIRKMMNDIVKAQTVAFSGDFLMNR